MRALSYVSRQSIILHPTNGLMVVPLYIDKITAPTMSFQTMYYTNSAFNVPAKPLGGAIVAVGHPSVADLLGYPDNLTRY